MPITRQLTLTAIAVALFTCTAFSSPSAEALTVNFEDLAPSTVYVGPGGGTYDNGDPGGLVPGDLVSNPFVSNGASLFNQFGVDLGFGFPYWNGFAISNTGDTATGGFGNQYSAITGGGVGGSGNYAVGFGGGPAPTITLPVGLSPTSVRITNTTYGYRAVELGDDGGFNSVRKFGDDTNTGTVENEGIADLFELTITGKDAGDGVTGTILFALSDYTFVNNLDDYSVDSWELVDLSSLSAGTTSLEFSMTTTDVGGFGPNTPLYFALDNLVVGGATPEPSTLALGLLGLIGLCAVRRRKR